MKILYFYQYFTTPKGAFSTRAYEFARRWVKAGDQVTVVTTVYDKSDLNPERFLSKLRVEGIELRVAKIRISNRQGFAFQLLTFLSFALISSWYALVLPADVVLASSGPITAAVPGLLASFVRRKPFVFEVRDLWPENAIQLGLVRNRCLIALLRGFERLCYFAARRVVALSDGMAEWIRERYGVEHVEVVPNASDNELAESVPAFRDLPAWAAGKRLVVYAGALGFSNGAEQLLAVAGHLRDIGSGDIEIAVIGAGGDRMRLEDEARRLGLANLHFLGQHSRVEMFGWLKAAMCALSFFRPSPFFDMASPNKIYDAFAAGIPVVQNTQGWIKSLLERERCGITVPRGDSCAMALAIAELARDDGMRRLMAVNARRVAREQFDRTMLARRMRDVLLEMV